MLSLCLALGVSSAKAADIALYTITGSNLTAASVASFVSASAISLSAGTIEFGSSQATTWTNTVNSGVPYIEESGGWTSNAQSVAKNFRLTVTNNGANFSVTNISYEFRVTGAGPSAIGLAINGTNLYSQDAIGDLTQLVNIPITGNENLASAFIQFQGWTNGSRATAGSGAYRLDTILIQGIVDTPAGSPEVIITTANDSVAFSTNTYDVSGTANANTVGELTWTNTLAGIGGTIPAAATWTIPGIALAQGANVITVTGTNNAGLSSQDSVTITRGFLNVAFTSAGDDVSETSGSYTVTVFKSLAEGGVTGSVSIGGSAIEGVNYTIDTTNFVMNGATTSATFVITITDNFDFGPGYTVLLTLANVSGGAIVAPNSFTLTIGDNDQPAEGIAAFRFNVVPYLQVSTQDPNITVSNMSLSSGTIEVNQQTGTNFPFEPFIAETGGWTADSQATAKSFQFNIEPAAGFKVTVTGFSFRAYATAAGPSALGFDISGGAATFSMNMTNDTLQEISAGVTGVADMTNAFNILIQGWTNGTRATSGGGVLRLDDVVIFGLVESVGGGGETFLDEYEIDAITVVPNNVSITVNITSNGVPYTLLYTTNLLTAPTPIGTADTEVATGGPVTLQDSSTAEPHKFYWIRTND